MPSLNALNRCMAESTSTSTSISITLATSPASVAMSKDLKKRGWSFVGPTTVYAFMQAVGLVNDHLLDCPAQARCAALA